jgi:transposase
VEEHLARWSGLLQADAYSGYNKLYVANRTPSSILEAACWAHARRPFFALADVEASARRKASDKSPAPISPVALDVVQRIDALFEIERGLRGIALGRKSWLFAASDRGGQRAAAMYSLIVTAKMNDIDPQAWLADVLDRIADHPTSQLDDLRPWNWCPERDPVNRAA